jgi:hypothetical protein
MGFSMIIFMAIMLAVNIGFMVLKSVKATRRKKRLEAIKKLKLEKHN